MLTKRLVLVVVVSLWPLPALAADLHAELASLCAKLSAGCQTCGRPAAERTASASSNAAAPDPALSRPVDQWGRPVRISVNNNQLRVESAGADGVFDTPDDATEHCPMQ